ncbi:lasso RiPP family leader peptide-containing protein [Streptomyces sp. NPDC014991]|uniref:lasso RiPP family leader peptide-containing protein n=1 Tax=Streptomyces sp. NPDC014991 TaxID=3364935 RepID=UPI0036FAD1D2
MTYDAFSEYLSDHAVDEGKGTLPDGPPLSEDIPYVSPVLIDLGHVRDVTLGSSPNGNADANSQYYW